MSDTKCETCKTCRYVQRRPNKLSYCNLYATNLPNDCRGCPDHAPNRDKWEDAAKEAVSYHGRFGDYPDVKAYANILRRHFPEPDRDAIVAALLGSGVWHFDDKQIATMANAVLAALKGEA